MRAPRPSERLGEAVKRLRHNVDFGLLRDHLQAELDYCKYRLVTEADPSSFRELQGHARRLQETLELITKE